MTKRILSIVLLIALVSSFSLLASCDKKEEESSGSVVETSGGFPLEAKNWNETITILTHDLRQYSTCEIAAEQASSEPVENAFYERNAYIEEHFGITIEVETLSDQNEIVDKIRLNCQSSLDEYQAVCDGLTYISSVGVEGFLYDINSLNYINTSEPWWDQSAVRDLAINDKLWFVCGDIIVSDDEATWGMYFNKDLVTQYGLESPYDLVREDKWTLDTMYSLAKQVGLMHGSTMSFDPTVGDQWGLVTTSYDCYALMLGCGEPMVTTEDGSIKMRIDNEENVTAFNNIFNILTDTAHVGVADFFGAWDSGVYGDETKIFTNGNALFMPGMISLVSNEDMREATIHYGILPMPKRSELQDNYTTSVSVYWCPVISIPISNVDKLDATCYALEAMAYYGKEMVTSEYYDRTLTYKRFADDESGDMLDLIFRNRTYDLGAIFNFADGNGSGMLYFYTTLLMSKSNTIASNYEARATAYQTSIQELMDQINRK